MTPQLRLRTAAVRQQLLGQIRDICNADKRPQLPPILTANITLGMAEKWAAQAAQLQIRLGEKS